MTVLNHAQKKCTEHHAYQGTLDRCPGWSAKRPSSEHRTAPIWCVTPPPSRSLCCALTIEGALSIFKSRSRTCQSGCFFLLCVCVFDGGHWWGSRNHHPWLRRCESQRPWCSEIRNFSGSSMVVIIVPVPWALCYLCCNFCFCCVY